MMRTSLFGTPETWDIHYAHRTLEVGYGGSSGIQYMVTQCWQLACTMASISSNSTTAMVLVTFVIFSGISVVCWTLSVSVGGGTSMLVWQIQLSECSWVLTLFHEWIIRIGNALISASLKICQKRHLFSQLYEAYKQKHTLLLLV